MIAEAAIAYAGLINQCSVRPFVRMTARKAGSVVDCICGNVLRLALGTGGRGNSRDVERETRQGPNPDVCCAFR